MKAAVFLVMGLAGAALAISCASCVKNDQRQTAGQGDRDDVDQVDDSGLPPAGADVVDPPWEPRACTGSDVLCVDSGAGAGGDGSAQRPFRSVQAAIDAARDGAIVQVAAGSYSENLKIEGKRVRLYGGFAAGGDFQSRDRRSNVTVLAPGGGGAVVTVLADGAAIDGFRITGGTGRCDEDRCEGGGVYAEGDDIEIARNDITGNKVEHEGYNVARGGGIRASGKVRIIGNVIRGNRAERGAGIFADGTLLVQENRVERNIGTGDHGGGMSLAGASVQVVRNIVIGNEVSSSDGYAWGGGVLIHSQPTQFTMRGNLVVDNLAASGGSGVFIDDGAVGVMIGDIIVRNRCGDQGGAGLVTDSLDDSGQTGTVVELVHATIADNRCPGVKVGGNAIWAEGKGTRVTVRNSILWNNGPAFYDDGGDGVISATYTLSEEPLPGTGNLSADPRFASSQDLDYHLRSTAGRYVAGSDGKGQWVADGELSPAIDKAAPGDPHDKEPAPNGGRADLGAYGNTEQASKSP